VIALQRVALSLVAVGSVLALSACGPEDVDGAVKCERDDAGRVVCSYTPATPPTTTTPPVTTPPTTVPPVTEEPPTPVDPNAGLPAAEVTAVAQTGGARLTWTTGRTDITGWRVSRDGTDTSGTGAWGTDLPATARSQVFGLLRGGDTYTLTLVGKTSGGDLKPVTAQVVPIAPPNTDPPDDPEVPTTPGDSAAARLGWGTPIAAGSDEFNGTTLDRSKWSPYNGPGHAGNGRRVAGNNVVGNGYLRQVGAANGDSAGLASTFNQRYGKWEARVRSQGSGSGRTYHPLLIIWPQSDRWPADGEYDFLENGAPGAACAESFIHYPHPNMPVQQEFKRETNCGAPLSEWHNVAFEWTPDFVAGYIDGRQWFKYSGGAGPGGRKNIQDMPSGHLTIQLDNFHGSGMQPATYDIDWVRTYR
jgi:hypothetical protein